MSGPKFEIKPTTKQPSRLDFHFRYFAETPRGWLVNCSCGFRARVPNEDAAWDIYNTHLEATANQMLLKREPNKRQ